MKPDSLIVTLMAFANQLRFKQLFLLILVLFLLDLVIPGGRTLSLLIGGGLVFSALTNTCGMAAVLSKLPYNRRQPAGIGLEATLSKLAGRQPQEQEQEQPERTEDAGNGGTTL